MDLVKRKALLAKMRLQQPQSAAWLLDWTILLTIYLLLPAHLAALARNPSRSLSSVNTEGVEGSFFVLSDVHLDLRYDSLAPIKPNFCRSSGKDRQSYSPTATGLPVRSGCDCPYSFLLSTLSEMKAVNPNPEFILITGDIAPHELKHYDVDFYNFELSLRNATQAIQTFFPDTPTFPVLGNHDVYPQDQLPYGPNEVLETVAAIWKHWIPASALPSFLKGGYYSVSPKAGLRLLALNTLYYNVKFCTRNVTKCHHKDTLAGHAKTTSDPVDQFSWLSEQLEMARENNEKLL